MPSTVISQEAVVSPIIGTEGKAIEKRLRSADKVQGELKTNLAKLLVKDDQRLILLQMNHDSRKIFANYLRDGTVPERRSLTTQAEHNLVNAFEECEAFVAGWGKKDSDLVVLLRLLKNRLGFIFYILDDEGSVYTVFEVLNSRGLDVDWLDKCKSALMGIVYEGFEKDVADEHQAELHTTWGEIYKVLGKKMVPGHEVLRFAATLIQETEPSKPLGAGAALDFFREHCSEDPPECLAMSKWLLAVAQELRTLYENPRLEAVTDIAHARLLAVSISQCDFLKPDQKDEVLDAWERITFKIFGLYRKDARTGVGNYTRAAHKIHNRKVKTRQEVLAELKEISKPFPVEQAIEQVRKEDCYNGWETSLRYFLYRYEEHLCEMEGGKVSTEIWEQIWRKSPSSSIEHIHPQARTAAWRGKLGKGKWSLPANVNRVGNLLLLPPNVNSQAGQKSFAQKKQIYKRNFLRMHAEVIKCSDWTKSEIGKREERLLEWAKTTWHD